MPRILRNSDVLSLEFEVPPGHQHVRVWIRLADGEELVLQEATVANLVRGYVTLKTHPLKRSIRMEGRALDACTECKEGFAAWQLLED